MGFVAKQDKTYVASKYNINSDQMINEISRAEYYIKPLYDVDLPDKSDAHEATTTTTEQYALAANSIRLENPRKKYRISKKLENILVNKAKAI